MRAALELFCNSSSNVAQLLLPALDKLSNNTSSLYCRSSTAPQTSLKSAARQEYPRREMRQECNSWQTRFAQQQSTFTLLLL